MINAHFLTGFSTSLRSQKVAAPLLKSKGQARSVRAPEVFEHHRVHDHQRVQSLRTDSGHDEFSSAVLVMWLW